MHDGTRSKGKKDEGENEIYLDVIKQIARLREKRRETKWEEKRGVDKRWSSKIRGKRPRSTF